MLALAAITLSTDACSTACDTPKQANIDGAELAQAKGVFKAEPGDATIVLTAKSLEPEIPEGKTIRLAVERTVQWKHVNPVLDRLDAAHKKIIYLVGKRRHVRAFHLREKLKVDSKHAFRLIASHKGRSCVAPAGSAEMSCVQRIDKKHIDRAFTRDIVRTAHKNYGLSDVIVEVDAELEWADVVRAVDAARTCCDKPLRVFVKAGLRDQSAEIKR